MRLNILKLSHLITYDDHEPLHTHEGAPARVLTAEQALRRSVLSCMLWEGESYEDGAEITGRIRKLVPQVAADSVAALAVEARERMNLRHVPLLLVREMARYASHRGLVAETLTRVIQRADELAEFVAIYWAEGKQPLSAQVKKGLAAAFCNSTNTRWRSTIAPQSFDCAMCFSFRTPGPWILQRRNSGSDWHRTSLLLRIRGRSRYPPLDEMREIPSARSGSVCSQSVGLGHLRC